MSTIGTIQDKLEQAEDHTVLTWVMTHDVRGPHGIRSRDFRYAALKVGGRWYTTISDNNPHVDKILHADILAVLLSQASSPAEYASSWRRL